jgi:tRNA G26 N,N-dimethylase Trm1
MTSTSERNRTASCPQCHVIAAVPERSTTCPVCGAVIDLGGPDLWRPNLEPHQPHAE